jgi:hypothetical protein
MAGSLTITQWNAVMLARKFFAAPAAIFVLSLSAATLGHAGEWLGGQYWGQVAGCANCGGSMYGSPLPPGAIWVGVVGSGSGPSCGCQMHQGDIGPIISDEMASPSALNEIVPIPPQASDAQSQAESFSRRVSHIEAVEPADRNFRATASRVQIKTHTSQPERLERKPIYIVSPDGSAGRMYR